MTTQLIVALIAGAVAIAGASISAWNARDIAKLKIAEAKRQQAEQRLAQMSHYSEPLARSAYELQSRLYNILQQGLIDVYLVNPQTSNDRTRAYVVDHTTFVIAQYLCWTELVRREIQFIDLGENDKTRKLVALQRAISQTWLTDQYGPSLRLFAGEQQAIGEAARQAQACMAYGGFLKAFPQKTDALVDALRNDINAMSDGIEPAQERMKKLQNQLIELLEVLDPDYLRFPKETRSKV